VLELAFERPAATSCANAARAAYTWHVMSRGMRGKRAGAAYLIDARHLTALLLGIVLLLLGLLVEVAYEALLVALVPEPVLVLRARGSVLGDVRLAVLAVVLLVRNPILAHGRQAVRRE
jgi:hypothetical protein